MVNNNTNYAWIKFLIALVAILGIHKIIFVLLQHYYASTLSILVVGIAKYTSLIAALAIWTVFLVHGIKCIYYHNKTGRNYTKDHKAYQKDLLDLIKYVHESDPYRLNASTLPTINWWDAEGVILGHIGDHLIHRASSGVGNLALFGLPGSHKTVSQIIPTALRFNSQCGGGGVFCIDIKGDVLHWTRQKRVIKIFNPEDKNSCHFNVFDRVAEMSASDLRIFAEMISEAILPDANGKDDNYFTSGGRSFFCGIMLYLLHQNMDTTFPQVIDFILHNNAIDVCKTIAASDSIDAQRYTNPMIGSNERNVSGCYDCIAKAIRPYVSGALSELLDGNGECITPQALLRGYDVYIEIPQNKISIYGGTTSLIVQTFLTEFMRMEDSGTSSGTLSRPSVIFLLDEFPQLNFDFSVLSQALSTLRSKGVTLFLAQQSIAQLEQKYGEAGCRAIIDTCSYVSIMGAQDPRSREYFQKMIGRQMVIRKSTSKNKNGGKANHGESAQESMEYIFEAADFGNLEDDVIICINGKYIQAQKTNCWEAPNEPFDVTHPALIDKHDV